LIIIQPFVFAVILTYAQPKFHSKELFSPMNILWLDGVKNTWNCDK